MVRVLPCWTPFDTTNVESRGAAPVVIRKTLYIVKTGKGPVAHTLTWE
jgi:hypothetical protein